VSPPTPPKTKRGRSDQRDLSPVEESVVYDQATLEESREVLLRGLEDHEPDLDELLDAAVQLAGVGFAADADMVLRQAIESFPDRAEPQIDLAQLYLDCGHEGPAAEVAANALNDHPRNPELHRILAFAHERMGTLAEAANHLAAILATDADDPEANRQLATILERLGDHVGATRCLKRVVEVTRGQDLAALTALGIALSSTGDHAEAIHVLTDVAQRSPDVASIQADLAMALFAAGRVEESIWGFSEALRLDPQSAQAHCGLGLAYQRLERWQEAAAAFRMTEQLAPDQAVGPLNLGLVLGALGEGEEARQALLRAAAIAPDDVGIREALQSLSSHPSDADLSAPLARFSGDLETFGLPEVLEFMRLQHKTGSLVVSSRQGAGIVRLVNGRITSASAPGVQRLGESLVSEGIIDRPTLDSALARQRAGETHTSEMLGTILLRERPADHDRFTQAVLRQVLAGLTEMLRWKEGAFSFHPGGDKDLPPISFDLQHVMMELFRGPLD
jgi:Flp pilus assembly protein TadD